MKNFQETSNLKDIHFNFDQYGLDSNSKEVLQQNASYLKQNPGMKIEIQGHCDERGTNNEGDLPSPGRSASGDGLGG